jgi:endonuclease YncB( thermonuclease family)
MLIWGRGVSAVGQFCDIARSVVLATLCCVPAALQAEEACRFVTIGTGIVRAVTEDGIQLEDGRTVRLAGIEDSRSAPPAGTALTLKRIASARETDRYGRADAHVFTSENGVERWFQAEVVRKGLARVSARIGDMACARSLQAEEQKARAAKLGLWGEPYYVMSKAEDPAGVLKGRGRFALVEGKVLSVRESGGTIYVNFGRRWSEDFTVTIAKRNERAFSAAGLEPKSLSGRRVRVRGWIEERGGPWVEAARPEQIEVLAGN